MQRQIPTATVAAGAATAPNAAREYVAALARGDARAFAAVTGSSVTSSAMASKRWELFGSSLREEAMEFTPDEPGASSECTSIVLTGGALALEDAISSVSPDMAEPHRLRILVRAKSSHSWFVLGAEARPQDAGESGHDAQVPKKPVILLASNVDGMAHHLLRPPARRT